MTVLEARGLARRYHRGEVTVEALNGVDFTLDRGEILGVVGESGCGKSTLLRLLSGLEKPDAGEIRLMGRTLSPRRSREDRRQLQMVFQDAVGSFDPRRSIAFSLRETVRALTGREPDLQALCALVGLDPLLARRRPGELSGGQCQRFAIARAAAPGPAVLLCDEITSALDVSSQAQILELLAGICRDRGAAAVFVSHSLGVVSCLCSRVLVMRRGLIVEQGETRALLRAPKEEYTGRLLASVLLP